MGTVRALLVAVRDYPVLGYKSLPLCINDLYAMKTALHKGLNISADNVLLCGETGTVTSTELVVSMNSILSDAMPEDTFIFYFSGHGGNNCLALSNGNIRLQELIDVIEKVNTKNKIIILDSCHSGSFSVDDVAQMDITQTVDFFSGRGYAVLASCNADQVSGFNNDKKISLYTSWVCDALTSRYLIRKGKKSLEAINEAIFHFAELSNKQGNNIIQQPIFRSNIGGTIFFDVEEYNPYKVKEIYEESDEYIIYEVKPMHHGAVKRLSVKVILRFSCTMEQIARMATEIKEKVLYCDVYQNKVAEILHKGNAANIIWCYFGYDEDDIINGNFVCHTTWVDELQDKKWWYRTTKNTRLVQGVYIELNPSYDLVKSLQDNSMSKDELIKTTCEYTSNLISMAERYIKIFREYLNTTLTEEELIDSVQYLNKEITIYFFKQSDLPIAPKNLHKWANIHTQIAGTIHDFSLFYDKVNLDKWSAENRKWLMLDAIKRYESELEELKEIDGNI